MICEKVKPFGGNLKCKHPQDQKCKVHKQTEQLAKRGEIYAMIYHQTKTLDEFLGEAAQFDADPIEAEIAWWSIDQHEEAKDPV